MSKKFEEPMINVYNFKYHDIATEGVSTEGDGFEGNEGGGTVKSYSTNYITVQGTFDENVPL